MNKAELVDALAEHFGGNKAEATRALNAVLQTITFKTATEGRVSILGFGTFEKTVRPPRTVSDPATGRKIRVKAFSTPVFRAGAEFKAYVSGVKKVPRRRRIPPTRLIASSPTAPLPEAPHSPPDTKMLADETKARKGARAAPLPAAHPAAARTDSTLQPRKK